MMSAVAILAGLALALTAIIVIAARLWPGTDDGLVADIEKLLPRIQCAQCGYPGCRPYATAIAAGTAPINLCPPGGQHAVQRLADLLGRDPLAVDRSRGAASTLKVARIDESACIGCHLCSLACPVDAIVGVHQTMHTVIASHCTGCELCLPPCPVDCIAMAPRDA